MRESIQAKGIRAPAYTSGVTRPVRRIDRIQRGTAEPPSVALLRHILNPTVIVTTLLLTVLAYGSPLSQHYLALAALAFLISAQVVSDPVLDSSGNRGLSMLLNHRIFSEWLLVSAALLLLAFALKVTELFSRRVILTWFAITPFVVVAAQVGFRRYAAFSALRGKILQSHVIIGANEVGARLALRLRANPHLGAFRGFFDDRHSRALARTAGGAAARRHRRHRQLRALEQCEQYLHLSADAAGRARHASARRAEGHDCIGLLRARPVRVRHDAGAGLRSRRHSAVRSPRDAVRRHERRAQARQRHRVRDDPAGDDLAAAAGDCRRRAHELARPGPVPAASLRSLRRIHLRLQVPHDARLRGRPHRHAGAAQRSARDAIRQLPAPDFARRAAAAVQRARAAR